MRFASTAVTRSLLVGALALYTTTLICRSTREPTRRVAIRVECDQPRACELAEALAEDVWTERHGAGLPLDVVVESNVLPMLAEAGVAWTTLVPDIDEVARAETLRIQTAVPAADWFAEFRDYPAIVARMRELAERTPDRVSMHQIGTSLEGRPIYGLRIGTTGTPMLVNGTQHAREWISTMTTTCIADRVIHDYATDPKIRAFADSTTLWVVPVVNPDGYHHSWTTNRYWRKNRRDGHGVDLNRNWSVAFGGAGSSKNERAETYRGPHAFSEPETAALRDLGTRERIAIHLDLHTYGQLILYPWDYTAKPPPDRDRYAGMGDRMASAMFAQHDTRYRLMAGAELYPSAGTMSDWFYGEVKAVSYTIELRPKGGSGFVLPPEQIRPTCDEGLAATLELRAMYDR